MRVPPLVPPLVAILGTGGTIASQRRPGGVVPALDIDDLVSASAEVDGGSAPGVRIRTRTVVSLDSSAMTPADQWTLTRAVHAELDDPDVVGVVVTHGTDTLEESAMMVDLAHRDDRPVVFTGAQYPADAPGADGPTNLAAAIDCARDPASRGRGVLVAFGGRILPARGVYKADTTDVAGFASVAGGLARPLLDIEAGEFVGARTHIVTAYTGLDPAVIGFLVTSGARGLVLAGLGSGNAHPDVCAAVADAIAAGVVVVVSTRVPRGEVVATYGGGGGAVDLLDAGAIVSPWLRPPQARVALGALLSTGADVDAVREFFAAGSVVDDR